MRFPLCPHILLLCFLISACGQPPEERTEPDPITSVSRDTVTYDQFGMPYDSARVSDHVVRRNESLYEILDRFEVSPQQIYSITRKAGEVIDPRSLRPGQSYRVYAMSDSSDSISGMVWQPSAVEFVVMDWQDSLRVYRREKEIVTQWKSGSAVIERSLYETMIEQNLTPMLASKLAEVYAWEIDFFSLRAGDSFKVLYEQRYVDGEFFSTGEIIAAEFTHRGETYRAFRFSDERIDGYFDGEGNSVQKALKKAPFNYSQRISSHFSHSRYHPILKRRMPHYGIDYAAPHGTPVLSVGDGTVTEAQHRGANGNIVKITHNNTYRTAYLHLSGFASGIRRGAKVKQGQVIGYVGNTGRSTGTHLDYRIYKNNRPVNPLTIDLPASESIPGESMPRFQQVRSYYTQKLEQVDDPGSDMRQEQAPMASESKSESDEVLPLAGDTEAR